jgi:hypothetical protein
MNLKSYYIFIFFIYENGYRGCKNGYTGCYIIIIDCVDLCLRISCIVMLH